MNMHLIRPPASSVPPLVQRLRALWSEPRAGVRSHARNLFCYCALDRERIAAIRMPHAAIVIVLHGVKEVWLGDRVQVFPAGSVFVLPRDVPLDVVNIPSDDGLGVYESMIMEVPALPVGVAPLSAAEKAAGTAMDFSIPVDSHLAEALVHAATAIADGAQGDTVKALRMAEVLTLIRPFAAARTLFATNLTDQVAWLIGSAPARDWYVAEVADQLRIGASTLRRRLAADGTSFREILADERLRSARQAIEAGGLSVAAAEAAGYASRSHFSRRYREHFGTTPTGRI